MYLRFNDNYAFTYKVGECDWEWGDDGKPLNIRIVAHPDTLARIAFNHCRTEKYIKDNVGTFARLDPFVCWSQGE